jgi:hypothetical protein
MTFATALILMCAQADWAEYGKGVKWEACLDAAKKRAATENKPILFHQLAGDMNKEGC